MNETRKLFLDCGAIARRLVATDEVAAAWDGPSALAEFTVRGLAGHLLRAVGSVEAYLDREEPARPPISAAEYYAAAVDNDDISSPLHIAIRERGEQMAADGRDALLDRVRDLMTRMEDRLQTEPQGRLVRVHKDMVLRLDDYLITRLVELVVHIDDLAVSVGLPTPSVPDAAVDATIRLLVDVGRHRHSDLAVVRALSRRERDSVNALRVL